jgi:hypothetical protein
MRELKNPSAKLNIQGVPLNLLPIQSLIAEHPLKLAQNSLAH